MMPNLTLLLIVGCIFLCVITVEARPPENLLQGPMDNGYVTQTEPIGSSNGSFQKDGLITLKKKFNRLPGVCRRLKRRRITVLCNVEQYCSALRDSLHGQICPCPKASRCTHFFLKSF